MKKEYFISHNGQQLGPVSLDQVFAKVKEAQLELTDYIFDEQKQDWVLLMEHQDFSAKLAATKPKAPPMAKGPAIHVEEVPKHSMNQPIQETKAEDDHMVQEWYVLKGENKFGPFAFPDIVKMLQEKVVYEFDFAWHPGLSTWKRIAELEAFHHDQIKKLKDTLMPEVSEVFFRRRHRRVSYGGTVIVHDNKSVWKGHGMEISPGGAGVVMENSMIVPGQTLFLHFKPGDGVPPFNAVCEVVSKKYVEGVKDKSTPIRYGLKFKSISTNTQKFLQDFTQKGGAAKAA